MPLRERASLVLILLVSCVFAFCQNPAADPAALAQQLASQQRWQAIVDLAAGGRNPSADFDYYYGSALAHLDRWEDARRAFLAGQQLSPTDPRFPLELAGLSFKQKNYPQAASLLRHTLHLSPGDSYAKDFLATVYFLQGNLPAALKYWSQIGKPQIIEVRSEPVPQLQPAILDHAFEFSPASQLTLAELLTSEARLRSLQIYPEFHFELRARPDGNFDLEFLNQERDTLSQKKWLTALLFLRALPCQTVYPEFFNLGSRAINLTSMFRWDAQKRRARAAISSPLGGNPAKHLGALIDLRSENWDLRNSFTGPGPLLGGLNLRREAAQVNYASYPNGKWNWWAGAEISHRDFRDVIPGSTLTPELTAKGYQLKQLAQLGTQLWNAPEHRLTIDAMVNSQAGRLWSQSSHLFEKLQGSVLLHWFPQPAGDDYETHQQIRAGKTWGEVPFDELFDFGIDNDTDLWMRGHIATRDGRRGSGPLGRNYFLSNSEFDKNLYGNGLLTLKLGPFVDTGKITDPSPGLGSRRWLWDVGVQLKAKIFGAEAVLSYGKDLRSGNNAIYLTVR